MDLLKTKKNNNKTLTFLSLSTRYTHNTFCRKKLLKKKQFHTSKKNTQTNLFKHCGYKFSGRAIFSKKKRQENNFIT